LSVIYRSQGFVIYPQRQAIVKGEEEIQVRSKTFALLLLLLEKPGEVLSKSYLLDTIWDDVKVEEQVLVQSIRELRQLFGSADIIQTYPRKGYSWAADVEKLEQSQAIKNVPLSPTPPSPRPKIYALASVLLILGLVLSALLYQTKIHSVDTEVVIVMPVKSQLPGNDYNWVPLGVMDQIIHSLISDKKVQVAPLEYVFQIMQFAHLPRAYESEETPRLFEVSGATLIVETQISGAIENFRMDYKLRTRKDVKRGVIFAADLNQLLYKLSETVANETGQKLHNAEKSSQASFHNELMARGVEKLDQKEYEAAQNLFKSLVEADPENLYAREQLICALLWLTKYEDAKLEIDQALPRANKSDLQSAARLYFYRAVALKGENNIANALSSLDNADRLATESDTVLVQAQSAEMRAQIQQDKGNFSLAQTSFEQALKFNGVIRCSIGMSHIHLKLAQLFLLQGQSDRAYAHYTQAKQLIDTHQLDDMRSYLDSVKIEKPLANQSSNKI
jgi:transcriptional activator of cad operon